MKLSEIFARLSKEEQAKVLEVIKAAKAKSIEEKMQKETSLIPDLVAETVIDELQRLVSDGAANKLYNNRNRLVQQLVKQTYDLYQHSPKFAKSLKTKSNKDRDTLYMWMRHWLSSDIHKMLPDIFEEIPDDFKVGKVMGSVLKAGRWMPDVESDKRTVVVLYKDDFKKESLFYNILRLLDLNKEFSKKMATKPQDDEPETTLSDYGTVKLHIYKSKME